MQEVAGTMSKYDELIKSLESYREQQDGEQAVFRRSAEAIVTLQSAIDEKQRILDEALSDLAKCRDCKHCALIDQCSINRIERNLAYGGCASWQWRGTKREEKAS